RCARSTAGSGSSRSASTSSSAATSRTCPTCEAHFPFAKRRVVRFSAKTGLLQARLLLARTREVLCRAGRLRVDTDIRKNGGSFALRWDRELDDRRGGVKVPCRAVWLAVVVVDRPGARSFGVRP